MAIEIDCPAENDDATVVLGGTGAVGIISASGSATSEDGTSTHFVYQRVFALVFPGTFDATSPGPVPLTPPLTAATVDNPGAASAVWFFPNIPGAACNAAAPGAANTLAVWARFALLGPITAPSYRHFNGICGSPTSCPRPEFFEPPPSGEYSSPPLVALTTAPAAWRVEATGKAWNGHWLIELRAGGDAPAWEKAGDGVTTFQVRLSGDGPPAARWRLTFSMGDERLCYTQSDEAWHALGVNVLDLDPDATSCSFIPPATVRVTPG